MDKGWFKLFRDIENWKYRKNPNFVSVWVHLLASAHHGENPVYDGYGNEIRKGQFSTGRDRIAKITGVPPTTVERILKILEDGQQIGQQKMSKCRVISIVNWDAYQNVDSKVVSSGQVDYEKSGQQKQSKNVVLSTDYSDIKEKVDIKSVDEWTHNKNIYNNNNNNIYKNTNTEEDEDDFSYSSTARKALNIKSSKNSNSTTKKDPTIYSQLSEKFLSTIFSKPTKSQIEKATNSIKDFMSLNKIDSDTFSKAIDNKLAVLFDPLVYEGWKRGKTIGSFLDKFEMYDPSNFDITSFYDQALTLQVSNEEERLRQIQLSKEFEELCKQHEEEE